MKNQFSLGQRVIWKADDFDGRTEMEATITKVEDDYCIAKTKDGISLWIDKDSEQQFSIKK